MIEDNIEFPSTRETELLQRIHNLKVDVLSIHRLIVVSHKSIGVRVCVRCDELWPCETAKAVGVAN